VCGITDGGLMGLSLTFIFLHL